MILDMFICGVGGTSGCNEDPLGSNTRAGSHILLRLITLACEGPPLVHLILSQRYMNSNREDKLKCREE